MRSLLLNMAVIMNTATVSVLAATAIVKRYAAQIIALVTLGSIVTLMTLILNTPAVYAQPAPNRRAEAQLVADAHPELWQGADNKRRLTTLICTVLNRQDNDMWGLLSKDDRNPPYVPEDILMWRPTRVHVDVASDSGRVPWIVHENTPSVWSWVSCGAQLPTPGPGVPDVPAPDLSLRLLQETLNHFRQEFHEETVKAEAERAAQRQFREDDGIRWGKVAAFIARYGSTVVAALIGGKLLQGEEAQ